MVNNFDVMKRMTQEGNTGIMVVPLGNVIRMKKVKAGSEITLGAPERVMVGLLRGDYVVVLLLAEKEEFRRIKEELEGEDAKASGMGVDSEEPRAGTDAPDRAGASD
jgi:hypothetical protein